MICFLFSQVVFSKGFIFFNLKLQVMDKGLEMNI